MSDLVLRLYPDSVLSQVAADVQQEEFNNDLVELVKKMTVLMHASKGIGLAAPQVGILKKIIVWGGASEKGVPEGYLINPLIMERKDLYIVKEGCLSFPEISVDVRRSRWIKVYGRDLKGEQIEFEATDLLANVIQHEWDHLQGVTFLNYLSKLKRDIVKKKMQKHKKTLTMEKFKQLFVKEMLKRKAEEEGATTESLKSFENLNKPMDSIISANENNSSGPGGNTNL